MEMEKKIVLFLMLVFLGQSYAGYDQGRNRSGKAKPSVAFVLTTWEKKGSQTTINENRKSDLKGARNSTYDQEDSRRDLSNSRMSDSYESDEFGTVSGSFDGRYRRKQNGDADVQVDENKSTFGDDNVEYKSSTASGSYRATHETEQNGSFDARQIQKSKGRLSRNTASDDASYSAKKGRASATVSSNEEFHGSTTMGRISEDIWKKIPDMQIVDRFQQEFKRIGFGIKASDEARNIALANNLSSTGIDPSDRAAVREFAEKENVNFVVRGEASVLSYESVPRGVSATARIGVEIVDVNSGDIVASYTNSVTALGRNEGEARSTSIVKMAIVAARSLSSQTMESWKDAAENGSSFTVEVRNVSSARSQKMPFEKALKSVAEISSQTSPKEGVLTYSVVYKGSKSDLGEAIIDAVGEKKGFEEENFDGPSDENGKIVFKFIR